MKSGGSTNKATHAKLPKLELKKFSGNPIYWHPFWESFESAIDKNTSLPAKSHHPSKRLQTRAAAK